VKENGEAHARKNMRAARGASPSRTFNAGTALAALARQRGYHRTALLPSAHLCAAGACTITPRERRCGVSTASTWMTGGRRCALDDIKRCRNTLSGTSFAAAASAGSNARSLEHER